MIGKNEEVPMKKGKEGYDEEVARYDVVEQ